MSVPAVLSILVVLAQTATAVAPVLPPAPKSLQDLVVEIVAGTVATLMTMLAVWLRAYFTKQIKELKLDAESERKVNDAVVVGVEASTRLLRDQIAKVLPPAVVKKLSSADVQAIGSALSEAAKKSITAVADDAGVEEKLKARVAELTKAEDVAEVAEAAIAKATDKVTREIRALGPDGNPAKKPE